MAKPPRGSDKPGEMCSYDPVTGKYRDKWLWEEILGEKLDEPDTHKPKIGTFSSFDPNTPIPEEIE